MELEQSLKNRAFARLLRQTSLLYHGVAVWILHAVSKTAAHSKKRITLTPLTANRSHSLNLNEQRSMPIKTDSAVQCTWVAAALA